MIQEKYVCVIGLTGQSAFMKTDHFPSPGETIHSRDLFYEPGGKGHNQAVACARMGIKTVFITAVGTDANAAECIKALENDSVSVISIIKDEPTAFAVIVTDETGENTVNVFGGAAGKLIPQDLNREDIMCAISNCEWLLLQNELPLPFLKEVLTVAQKSNVRVVLNPAPANEKLREIIGFCELITPNYNEACILAGIDPRSAHSDNEIVNALAGQGVRKAIITMGSKGAIMMENGELIGKVPVFHVGEVVDTTGAGDTFNGVLIAMLAEGKSLVCAAEAAAIAAGISVTRFGVAKASPVRVEVENNLQ